MVLMAKRPPKVPLPFFHIFLFLANTHCHQQGHRLLVIATTSLRPMLTDLGLASFDSELRVPPITRLSSLKHVLEAVELFPRRDELAKAVGMLQQAGFQDTEDGGMDLGVSEGRGTMMVGVKKLLSVVEMARQEPENVAERLVSALMGLGM